MIGKLKLFKSIFKGREDVFAIRWEKNGKKGYVPAYDLDWNAFKIHKEKGGSLKDYTNKKYACLTDDRLFNHFSGKEAIGIYPLLPEFASWFIVADFDGSSLKDKNWLKECRIFIDACEKLNLPVYLERSRSGEGGHVWLFFETPFPASKSRKIFNQLLTSCGFVSGKASSFDRLFPNQDQHSGKELGNLIALPFHNIESENQNSCFINPSTEKPITDQWGFLYNIQKISISRLEELYNKLINQKPAVNNANSSVSFQPGSIHIILDNQLTVFKENLPPLLLSYLKENLNFINQEYFIKNSSGKNTFGTVKYFKSLEENSNSLIIPRGVAGKLIRYCKEQNIIYSFEDKRIKLELVDFNFSATLYKHQLKAVEISGSKDFGVVVAPPGSGKTIMGLAIIAAKKQPALIIVHRKQLFDQWIERIQSFLGIPSFRIGRIEAGNYDIGQEITVAMIQSLISEKLPEKIYHSFGTILIDECHHIPARTFAEAINPFHSYYLYGFTATPFRKNKDEKLIFAHIGDIIHDVIVPANQQGNKPLSLIIQNTELSVPFNHITDKIETLLHILMHDTTRNELIVADIKREARAGRKILVLTERKAHIEILNQYLKASYEVITLTGEDNEEKRKSKFIQIENETFQILLATGQYIGEGIDINSINCLILAYPFSFEGKLVQYIGRVQRSKYSPIIYDYKDYKIEYLLNLFKERNKYYRKLLKDNKLSKFEELILIFKGREFFINETEILLAIDCIELPFPIEAFINNIAWKIRILDYNDENGTLFAEILDYNFPISQCRNTLQQSFYFYGIEKISFRNIDTSGLLSSVTLTIQQVAESAPTFKKVDKNLEMQPQLLLKTMKVPFWKIKFLSGAVSFPIYIEALGMDITFEISNPDIRIEFEAIREYFSKALKKKLITVEIAISYNQEKIISATAKSEDIDNINSTMIDTIRFKFVKDEILKPPPFINRQLHTLDQLPSSANIIKMYATDMALIDDLLAIRKSKHFLQIKYLAVKHEASIIKIRFVLQPFSFLFLLTGENNHHIVWETLDTEEATYIWHTDKTKESLKQLIFQLENVITVICKEGRQFYLEKDNHQFTRIIHDYSNPKKGFMAWKGMLEEKIT